MKNILRYLLPMDAIKVGDTVRFKDSDQWKVVRVVVTHLGGDSLLTVEHCGCRVDVYASCMALVERLSEASYDRETQTVGYMALTDSTGKILVPTILWMAGVPLGIVFLLWFFFFRG